MDNFNDWVIKPSDRRINLIDAINLILDLNKDQLDLVWKYLCVCMYKMYLISAEWYKNTNVEFLTIKKTSIIWVSMKDVGNRIGVKNISNLVLKEICGICEIKNPSKEQVNEYKMTEKQIYKNFTNLSEKKFKYKKK